MNKFEAGKTYSTSSVGDHNCIFKIEIISRTEKSALIKSFMGDTRRAKIHADHFDGGEYIRPENYSFAPIFRP